MVLAEPSRPLNGYLNFTLQTILIRFSLLVVFSSVPGEGMNGWLLRSRMSNPYRSFS